MSLTTGASFTAVTVNVAASEPDKNPGSVAVKVMSSEPFQSGLGIVIVAMRLTSISTVNSLFPE